MLDRLGFSLRLAGYTSVNRVTEQVDSVDELMEKLKEDGLI